MVLIKKIQSRLISLSIGLSTVLFPAAARSAERITFNLAPLGQFQIKVDDLATFVTTGSRSAELDYYLNRLPPEQLAKLPELLSTPLELNPLTIAKFSNSTVGEMVIKNFGKGIRGDYRHNGFYALRGALIAAAFDDEGLTVINLLHHYPLNTIHIDLNVFNQYLERATEIAQNRETINRIWFEDHYSRHEALKQDDTSQPPLDLKIFGQYSWQKRTLDYHNPHRPQAGLFDLYQPKSDRPIPLIVISHGIASNRQTFAYLGRHLASHGFAVAVVEHEEISLAKFDRFLSGIEPFPAADNLINHPLDISYVLDRLESESQIDLQQVGIIGQSFGGYAALALSGGNLIAESTASECQTESYPDVLLDFSSLAKCTFNQVYQSPVRLRDPRIKAVIAINPMMKIFGAAGISSINTPTMLISGTNDLIMPPVAEQIKPFSWLNQDLEKYLVLVKPATHFSFLQEGLGVLPVPNTVVGPSPSHAHPALKALSTAFFQVHLAKQSEYQTYLNQPIQPENNVFELSVVRSLSQTELENFP